jgi:hypothetical protein
MMRLFGNVHGFVCTDDKRLIGKRRGTDYAAENIVLSWTSPLWRQHSDAMPPCFDS